MQKVEKEIRNMNNKNKKERNCYYSYITISSIVIPSVILVYLFVKDPSKEEEKRECINKNLYNAFCT